jgi:hypothetical protein
MRLLRMIAARRQFRKIDESLIRLRRIRDSYTTLNAKLAEGKTYEV